MITFNTEIVTRLSSGSIKNVYFFGDGFDRPAPPYVVVKPMAGGDRKLLQIFVHAALGMQDSLEAYILRELGDLFKEPLESDGKQISVMSTGTWYGPYVDESDNTLAMSRDFYVPVIL
jgi:hypothetical protein